MAAIHFAFIIDGIELDPSSAESPEQVDRMERIMESISARMEGAICPEHHEAPRFLCTGDSLDDLSVQVHGCCEQLVELTTQRMSAQ